MTDHEERFWSRVDKSAGPSECWPWKLSVNAGGYGQTTYGGKRQYAHRLAYFCTHGPLDINLVVDHLCHNKRCVNPAHLRLTDTSGNALNRAGFASENQAGYRNVHWNGRGWRAQLRANGRNYSGGVYSTPEEASRAAELLRAQHMDYNFPPLDGPRYAVPS